MAGSIPVHLRQEIPGHGAFSLSDTGLVVTDWSQKISHHRVGLSELGFPARCCRPVAADADVCESVDGEFVALRNPAEITIRFQHGIVAMVLAAPVR